MKRVLALLTLGMAFLTGCASQGEDGSTASTEDESGSPGAIQALGNIMTTRALDHRTGSTSPCGEGLVDATLGSRASGRGAAHGTGAG